MQAALYLLKGWNTYCSVRGTKVPCIYGRESMQSGYKKSFENMARVFLYRELYSLIPSTRCDYSRSGSRIFICENKERYVFLHQKQLQSTRKKKNGQPSTGHCFYNTRRHRVIPISLFSRKGIQTAWTYHVIQRKLILNFSLAVKKLFLSCTSREICQYFPILIAGWKSTHSVVLRDISLAFCISLNFLLVPSSWRLTHWDCQCFRDLEPFCGQRIASFRRYHKDHQTD